MRPYNPSAFPHSTEMIGRYGMTLRDWFAGQAMAGICRGGVDFPKDAARAYRIADAMLAERMKGEDHD